MQRRGARIAAIAGASGASFAARKLEDFADLGLTWVNLFNPDGVR